MNVVHKLLSTQAPIRMGFYIQTTSSLYQACTEKKKQKKGKNKKKKTKKKKQKHQQKKLKMKMENRDKKEPTILRLNLHEGEAQWKPQTSNIGD